MQGRTGAGETGRAFRGENGGALPGHGWGARLNKAIWLLVVPVAAVAGFVAADHSGLFGTRDRTFIDYAHVTFVPVDAATRHPLEDVVVNCFIPGERTACTMRRREGVKATVEVHLGIVRVETRSLLFAKGERVEGADSTQVHLMFIHPNYERVTRSYRIGELLGMTRGETVVEMPAGG